MTEDAAPKAAPPQPFSLVTGGPLHRLYVALGLCDETMGRLGRRIVATVAVLWLPLLVLSAIDGRAVSGSGLPLLHDIDTLLRYLAALPMMLAAERHLHRRFAIAMPRFTERGLVAPQQQVEFERLLSQVRRWVDSPLPELFLLAFVYLLGVDLIWRQVSALDLDTWYGRAGADGLVPGLAGHWLQWVAVPLLQFLILRWYFRLLLWAVLLWRLSRLDLRLQALHPDQAGGLGFLAQLTLAFAPLLVAQGTMASGWVGGQILHAGATLLQFKLDLAVATVLSLAVVLAPLACFMPVLARAKRLGLSTYGSLATRYAADFERKWSGTSAGRGASPLGDADFQSLADMGNAYGLLSGMRVLPFGTRTVAKLAAAFLAPVAPLALTMFSVDELLNRALELLL